MDDLKNIPTTVRLSPDRREFLDTHNISLSNITNEAIDEKREIAKQDKRKRGIQFYSEQILLLAVGCFILAISATPRTFIAWLLTFSLGFFFVLFAIINIHQEFKHVRRKQL